MLTALWRTRSAASTTPATKSLTRHADEHLEISALEYTLTDEDHRKGQAFYWSARVGVGLRWKHLHTIMDRNADGTLVYDPAVNDTWMAHMDTIGLGMSRLQGPAAERGWTSLAHKYIDEQHVLGALNVGQFVYFDTSGNAWTAGAVDAVDHYTYLEMKEAIENFTLARLFFAKGKDGGTDVYPDGIESFTVADDPDQRYPATARHAGFLAAVERRCASLDQSECRHESPLRCRPVGADERHGRTARCQRRHISHHENGLQHGVQRRRFL